jgi:CRP/FNR family transcriptional regulator
VPDWLPFIEAQRKNFFFKKGEAIFAEGETVTGIYFLYAGKVKVHKQWNDEKEIIIRFVKKGDILGHRGFGNTTTYPVSATALEETTLCYVDNAFFMSTLKLNHELTFKLMNFYAAELHDAELRMRDLVHMDTKGRVSDALLMMQEQFGVDANGYIDLNIVRQDLSSFVGATYETVFRIMNELIKVKVIAVDGKRINILDAGQLREFTHPGLA